MAISKSCLCHQLKSENVDKLKIYITGIIGAIDMRYNEAEIALILFFNLSLGGNDFIPKLNEISHERWLKGIFENENFRRKLFNIYSRPDSGHRSVTIDLDVLVNLLQNFCCPNKQDGEQLSLEDVRQLSINLSGKDARITASNNICKLTNSSLQYVLTTGVSEAELSNVMEDGGLKKVGDMVEYELSPHVHYDSFEDHLKIPEEDLKEALTRTRMRRHRKRELIETPGKERQSRKHKRSTSIPRLVSGDR
ncbi:hypothetical protein CHS0354_005232 [Potamilus streckersoni]|uniref:Uncharacterized protein n=1 Tax=Potamilus streckersoni TaxID=2493646 RepID=A0AAE0VNY3_9BIVA|nr:hypothetical protein CHS0354_005232 [Potamilus streckersoni]